MPRAVAFRRADMVRTEAREALTMFMELWCKTTVTLEDVSEVLSKAPENWEFIRAKISGRGSNRILEFRQMEREPGTKSGRNPVVREIFITGPGAAKP